MKRETWTYGSSTKIVLESIRGKDRNSMALTLIHLNLLEPLRTLFQPSLRIWTRSLAITPIGCTERSIVSTPVLRFWCLVCFFCMLRCASSSVDQCQNDTGSVEFGAFRASLARSRYLGTTRRVKQLSCVLWSRRVPNQ